MLKQNKVKRQNQQRYDQKLLIEEISIGHEVLMKNRAVNCAPIMKIIT